MNKGRITYLFRKLGLMQLLDKAKFYYETNRNREDNAKFISENPGVKLPPDYMMFEAFQANYRKYYEGGKVTANWLIGLLEEHTDLKNKKILDWGCGPARVVRHLPAILGSSSQVYGTDYNPNTIAWCKDNIQQVSFSRNNITPPLSYPDNYFDIVYGISIFTHLSEQNHTDWFNELIRITKSGGILLLTTSGEAFKEKLTDSEKAIFDTGQLITRGNVKEGHRVYLAFQPPPFLRRLFDSETTILRHIEGKKVSWGIEQDVWILKKK